MNGKRLIVGLCALVFIFTNNALQSETTVKKILVVYYSKTGNTKRVAQDIAKKLNADIEEITDKKDRTGALGAIGAGKDATFGNETEIGEMKKNPSNYDLVIIGTPIWSWDMTPAVRTYLTKYKKDFKAAAYFTTSGSTPVDEIAENMKKITGKEGIAIAGFDAKILKKENVKKYDEKIDSFVFKVKQYTSSAGNVPGK